MGQPCLAIRRACRLHQYVIELVPLLKQALQRLKEAGRVDRCRSAVGTGGKAGVEGTSHPTHLSLTVQHMHPLASSTNSSTSAALQRRRACVCHARCSLLLSERQTFDSPGAVLHQRPLQSNAEALPQLVDDDSDAPAVLGVEDVGHERGLPGTQETLAAWGAKRE